MLIVDVWCDGTLAPLYVCVIGSHIDDEEEEVDVVVVDEDDVDVLSEDWWGGEIEKGRECVDNVCCDDTAEEWE